MIEIIMSLHLADLNHQHRYMALQLLPVPPSGFLPWGPSCAVVFSANGLEQRTNVLGTSVNKMCSNVAYALILLYGKGVNYTQPWTCTYVVFNAIVVRKHMHEIRESQASLIAYGS